MENLDPNTDQIKQIKTLNRWLIFFSVIIILWLSAIILYVDKKTSHNDEISIATTNNLINVVNSNINTLQTNTFFYKKDNYKINDIVLINHFFIKGVVIETSQEHCVIMYKDNNNVLQKVVVSKHLLLTSKHSMSFY